jgi:hypothetical protein
MDGQSALQSVDETVRSLTGYTVKSADTSPSMFVVDWDDKEILLSDQLDLTQHLFAVTSALGLILLDRPSGVNA